MPSPRSLSRSFERRTVQRHLYRQVHLNGMLMLEGHDYRWIEQGRTLAFMYSLSSDDMVVVSLPGQRPQQIEIPQPETGHPRRDWVRADSPLHIGGTNEVVEVAIPEETALTQLSMPTLYDHLLED